MPMKNFSNHEKLEMLAHTSSMMKHMDALTQLFKPDRELLIAMLTIRESTAKLLDILRTNIHD